MEEGEHIGKGFAEMKLQITERQWEIAAVDQTYNADFMPRQEQICGDPYHPHRELHIRVP